MDVKRRRRRSLRILRTVPTVYEDEATVTDCGSSDVLGSTWLSDSVQQNWQYHDTPLSTHPLDIAVDTDPSHSCQGEAASVSADTTAPLDRPPAHAPPPLDHLQQCKDACWASPISTEVNSEGDCEPLNKGCLYTEPSPSIDDSTHTSSKSSRKPPNNHLSLNCPSSNEVFKMCLLSDHLVQEEHGRTLQSPFVVPKASGPGSTYDCLVSNRISSPAPLAQSSSEETSIIAASENVDACLSTCVVPADTNSQHTDQFILASNNLKTYGGKHGLLNSVELEAAHLAAAQSTEGRATDTRHDLTPVADQTGSGLLYTRHDLTPVTHQTGSGPLYTRHDLTPVSDKMGPSPTDTRHDLTPVTHQTGSGPLYTRHDLTPVTDEMGPGPTETRHDLTLTPVTHQMGPDPTDTRHDLTPVTYQMGPDPTDTRHDLTPVTLTDQMGPDPTDTRHDLTPVTLTDQMGPDPTDTRHDLTPVTDQMGPGPTDAKHDPTPVTDQMGLGPTDFRLDLTPVTDQMGSGPTDTRHDLTPVTDQMGSGPTDTRHDLTPVTDQMGLGPTDTRHDLTPVTDQMGPGPTDTRHDLTPMTLTDQMGLDTPHSQHNTMESLSESQEKLTLGFGGHDCSVQMPESENQTRSKIKKQRRRAAFGAELKLENVLCQTQSASINSLETAGTPEKKPVLQENYLENHGVDNPVSSHLTLDPHSENRLSVAQAVSVSVSDMYDVNKGIPDDGPQLASLRVAHAEFSLGQTCDKECAEEPHVAETEPTSSTASVTVNKTKRKKRRSADVCAIASSLTTYSPLDCEDNTAVTHTDTDSSTRRSASKQRRSSLRLYRQQSHKGDVLSTVVDINDSKETAKCPGLPDATDQSYVQLVGETDVSTGISDSAELQDTESVSISSELEHLYHNKNYKRPADKTWETIFEVPSKGKLISKQKLKRYLHFEDRIPISKLKRRSKKAAQNGWNTRSKKVTKTEQDVLEKVKQLDKEMSDID